MKTLIFVGSPKRKGHTMALVNHLIPRLNGEVEVINVFDYQHIKPCVDCGYCSKMPGCSIKDDFQLVLDKIAWADVVVIASPMWFATLSGPMMSFFSRLQTISCGLIFRKDIAHQWDKAGLLIMTAGNKWHSMMKTAEATAEYLFGHMDAGICDFIYATSTDILPASQNIQTKVRIEQAAERLNRWSEDKTAGRYFQYFYSSVNVIKIQENLKEN